MLDLIMLDLTILAGDGQLVLIAVRLGMALTFYQSNYKRCMIKVTMKQSRLPRGKENQTAPNGNNAPKTVKRALSGMKWRYNL